MLLDITFCCSYKWCLLQVYLYGLYYITLILSEKKDVLSDQSNFFQQHQTFETNTYNKNLTIQIIGCAMIPEQFC